MSLRPPEAGQDETISSDLQLILNTDAGVNMRVIPNLTRANEAGGDTLLRQGILLDIFGMSIRESAQVRAHTAGAGTGFLVNNGAGIAAGGTTIATDTGTGAIIAGDIMTFAADAVNKYVVGTALAAGSFAIGRDYSGQYEAPIWRDEA
jgi:hypothetical protein